MIGRMESVGIDVPFRLGPLPDPHNPLEVIADIGASGLGLPDRDYYLKPEVRFQKAREEYLVHVANMFQLSGYSEVDAKKTATSVMQFETSLAKASLDNVVCAILKCSIAR